MKVEHTYHFQKCADAAYQKLSKLVHACRNYSLPKLGRFFETRCIGLLCLYTQQTTSSVNECAFLFRLGVLFFEMLNIGAVSLVSRQTSLLHHRWCWTLL